MGRQRPTADPEISFRLATSADLPGEHRVFCHAEGGLLARHGFVWSGPPFEAFAAVQQHALDHDPDRCYVAERGGEIVGFTSAIVRDDWWFLSALFIEPEAQARGIGRVLLGLAMADAPRRRATITDSIQPVSNALYGQHDLLPAAPVLGFQGTGRSIDEAIDLDSVTPSEVALAELDAATWGFDRHVDHAFWAGQARQHGWARGDAVVGCSYAWPNGRIGPILAADEEASAAILTAELTANPTAWVEIPGSSRSLIRTALAHRMNLEAPVGLLLLGDLATAPANVAISGYFLA